MLQSPEGCVCVLQKCRSGFSYLSHGGSEIHLFFFADLFVLEFVIHFHWMLIAYKVLELPFIQKQKPA